LNIVAKITNIHGLLLKYYLVINHWEKSQEVDFVLPCHGNAKLETSKNTPYIKTEKSVLNDLKKRIQDGSKPQEAYHETINLSGDPFICQTQSKTPRNKKQVSMNYIPSFLAYLNRENISYIQRFLFSGRNIAHVLFLQI